MPASKFISTLTLNAVLAVMPWHGAAAFDTVPQTRLHTDQASPQSIGRFEPREGRARPVVAVVGENRGTEMTDFVIPYSILSEAGSAEVHALAVRPGPVTMRPTSLKLMPQGTLAQFDLQYPDGADIVIVPAVADRAEPNLLAWIAAQGQKGALVVSICDGALVVARTGLMNGRRGTAHWFTHEMRTKEFPDTVWLKNTRYVVDGNVMSSAGISAAIPTSLALVEAISGRERAAAVAARYGITEWGPGHDSERFVPRFGHNLSGHFAVHYANPWFHAADTIGVPVRQGVDDVALALTMDAYSRTGRSRALALASSADPFVTRNGLSFIPDGVANGSSSSRMLAALPTEPTAHVFDRVLDGIDSDYGRNTADGVAYDFEYARGVK